MINLTRHPQHLRTNIHPKILRRLGSKFASPMGLYASDCIPSVHNLSFATPASDAGRKEGMRCRLSWARGDFPRYRYPALALFSAGHGRSVVHQISAARLCLVTGPGRLRFKTSVSPPATVSRASPCFCWQIIQGGCRDIRGKVGTKQKTL